MALPLHVDSVLNFGNRNLEPNKLPPPSTVILFSCFYKNGDADTLSGVDISCLRRSAPRISSTIEGLYLPCLAFDASLIREKEVVGISSLIWSLWLRFPLSIRLSCYRLLWRIAEWHHPRAAPRVIRLPFNLYAKDGYGVSVGEAIATQFVSENTTIPVPYILDVVSSGPKHPYFPNLQSNFILSTGIPGTEFGLSGVSADRLSEAQASVFVDTLRGWFDQLRALTPPSHAISGVNVFPSLAIEFEMVNSSVPLRHRKNFMLSIFAHHGNPLTIAFVLH